jgi:hypothetical protein
MLCWKNNNICRAKTTVHYTTEMNGETYRNAKEEFMETQIYYTMQKYT